MKIDEFATSSVVFHKIINEGNVKHTLKYVFNRSTCCFFASFEIKDAGLSDKFDCHLLRVKKIAFLNFNANDRGRRAVKIVSYLTLSWRSHNFVVLNSLRTK